MPEWIPQDWNYEPLTNDAMFHLVFLNNEKALRSLLSALLNIPETEMKSIQILNPMQHAETVDAKLTVLDLRLHLNDNTYLNIEMQVRRFHEWLNRTLVYSCRQITEQANVEGFSYSRLEPVIHIAILDHTLFENHKRFFTKYQLQDEEGYSYTDKLQFYVMDLKAIAEADETERKRGLVEWAEAFTARNWEQIRKIKNLGVKEAANQMQTIMGSAEQRQMIWSRRMAQLDYESMMSSARKEGLAAGREEGRAEGREEGRAEGRAEGTLSTLVALVKKGRLSVEEAAEEANMSTADFCSQSGLS